MSSSRNAHPARVLCTRPGCGRSFATATSLRQHRDDSHPRVFCTSPGCGRSFATSTGMVQHLRDSHPQPGRPTPAHPTLSRGGGSTSCSVCKAEFAASEHLEQHYLVKHAVVSLPRESEERLKTEAYFRSKWLHRGTKPFITDVLRVYNPGHREKRFKDYRARIMAKGGTDARISADGNTVPRFHGTTVRCGLGTQQQREQSLCADLSCSLCNIILAGFKKKKANVEGFLRFGPGIYVTATSSKANDYVKAYSDGSVSRSAMLACDVVAGRVYKVTTDMPQLVAPPQGYDSVCGEVGESLNYDELVVYENPAILPKFIIVYEVHNK